METAKDYANCTNSEAWDNFINGINSFTEDFFEDGRYGNTPPAERDSL